MKYPRSNKGKTVALAISVACDKPMAIKITEADFERLSWHDCHIWGLDLRVGDPDEQNWTSDIAFDIDFIAAWICGREGDAQFRVAPAELVFHGVTDPRINLCWPDSGFQVSVSLASIDKIEREHVRDQKVHLDRPYYNWRIALNWPKGGEVCFGAVGFTQTLLAEPVLTNEQHLSLRERDRLKAK